MSAEEEFRHAIRERAFVRAADGVRIRDESGGEYPWIFDFRALLFEPRWLERYADLFWERYASRYPFQVGGVESTGVALVAAIVMKGASRGTPVGGFFIRKSRKRDGLMKAIEGRLNEQPIILVDDILNSGSTLAHELRVLAAAGRRASEVFSILRMREESAYETLQQGLVFSSLFTLADFTVPMLGAQDVPKREYEVVWRFGNADPSYHLVIPKSAPALDDTRVYFGADDGVFRALSQDDGQLLWSYRIGKTTHGKGITSSPALHGGAVYFGAYDGCVYALDSASGEKRWSFDEADWVSSSPAVASDRGLLLIGLEFGLFRKRGALAALSLATGMPLWVHRTPELISGSPLYIKEHGLAVVGSNAGIVYACDVKTGEVRWRFTAGGEVKASLAYDAARDTLVFGSFDSSVYALSARDGAPRWRFETGAAVFSTPWIEGDTVYASSLDKHVYALECASGKKRWEFDTGGRVFASPIVAAGSLWIGSNSGRLYEIDPRSGVERGSFQFAERITSAIAHDPRTGRLFVPTVANELYCLRRKP